MNEIETRFTASVPAPDRKPYQGWTPCINWCLSHLGEDGWWFIGDGVFEFIDERDYLMFILRWN
jgi:hypothetical protein